MKKSYKFRVKYTVERELKIQLDEAQQKLLLSADNILIEVYLDEFGYSEFIGEVKHNEERYEIDYYEELKEAKVYTDIALTNLDICFFSYNILSKVYSDFIYGNMSSEGAIKSYIMDQDKHRGIMLSSITDLVINR